MKIAFCSLPAYGHVYPLTPLAMACQDAGHDVTMHTDQPFLDALPVPTEGGGGERTIDEAQAEVAARHPGAEGIDFAAGLFGDVVAGWRIEELLPRFTDTRPDLIVFEATDLGAGVVADVLDIPSAAVALSHARMLPILNAAVLKHHAEVWSGSRRTPPTTPLIADVLYDPLPPSWSLPGFPTDFPKRPLRTVPWSQDDGEVPDWLRRPGDGPRAYITLGTVAFGAVEALRRAVCETEAQGVEVLVAVGPEGDPSLLGPLPERVHVERFVPQQKVLPLVDLVVHHGGTGTILGCFANGLPQVLMPQGADQFINAERMLELGAGRVVRNEQPDGEIGRAVAGILAGGTERATARSIAAEMTTMPMPAEIVPELETLARRPTHTGG